MFVLFLESRAAQQVRDYCAAHPEHPHTVEETLQRCYDNSIDQALTSDDWVRSCLANDSHKGVDIDMAFIWHDTPEGRDYWRNMQMDDF